MKAKLLMTALLGFCIWNNVGAYTATAIELQDEEKYQYLARGEEEV
jgi:hypothetical protein